MTTFSVPEMSCGHCKSAIERAIASVDGHAQVTVDLTTREVTVQSDAAQAALIDAVKAEGYTAQPKG